MSDQLPYMLTTIHSRTKMQKGKNTLNAKKTLRCRTWYTSWPQILLFENRMCSLKVALCQNSNVKSLCFILQMETALHIAAKKGDTVITKLLVDWRCNPHLKNCQVIHIINSIYLSWFEGSFVYCHQFWYINKAAMGIHVWIIFHVN